MKLIGAAFGIVAMCTLSAGAQGTQTRSKTTVEVKDGKDITTTGCVERTARGEYVLTGVGTGGSIQYALVGKDDFGKHLGERIEVTGKATDLGDAKVKVETESKTEGKDGTDTEHRTTRVEKGDISGLPLLGVKSMKKLAATCW
jgi:hypothetical protein